MSLKKRMRQIVKKIVFRGSVLPQRFFLSQAAPQSEVTVWLHGAGDPVDVTRRHCQACALPFTLCIGFKRGQGPSETQLRQLTLRFCENGGDQRVLGEIGLHWVQTLESGDSEFFFFRSIKAVNHCLPKAQFWVQNLRHFYNDVRKGRRIRMSAAERHAMAVMFICPRPVSLLSVADERGVNIFPLNVMGDLSENFFAFCLKEGKLPAQFVEKTGRIVLNSVPMAEAPIAFRLGPNHNVPTIDLGRLPFATRASRTFGIPVPVFAFRVRELEVEQIHRLGFHTFFLARVISDEQLAEVPEFCVAHGFYEDWRIRKRGVDKQLADAEDARTRNQLSPEQVIILSRTPAAGQRYTA
jgi:flavin reductase (DIM6/NTAB) family NADH-FMN oxidoreductase RutF